MTPTYYDRPLLKEPVWKLDIPIYYWLGGASGAALLLGAAAQFDGDTDLKKFAQRCHWIGIAGSTLGGSLLIHDLGRPGRFVNMLRVFRPTSPMNLGAWILTAAAPLAITAGVFTDTPLGSIAGYGSGLFGIALAGYTGVLVSNTAIPIYRESRRLMPPLFLASAAATAASILDLIVDGRRASSITFAFGTAGRVGELAAAYAIESHLAPTPRIAQPLKQGVSGALWKTASVLTIVSLAISIIPGQSRARRRWAGVFGAAGSLCLRLAVHYAGIASARDPRAAFERVG